MLNTVPECDAELARITAEIKPLRVFPDLHRKEIAKLTRELGRALKRRIDLQHRDLFELCTKSNS